MAKTMKNILSYKPGSVFLGKEIKDWISYNVKNKTSHYKQAIQMQKYMTIKDNDYYIIKLHYHGTGCNEIIHQPIVSKYHKRKE